MQVSVLLVFLLGSVTFAASESCNFSGKIPHESDCRYYYECINGVKTAKKCPGTLEFSPTQLKCTFPETANCKIVTTTSTTTTPSPITTPAPTTTSTTTTTPAPTTTSTTTTTPAPTTTSTTTTTPAPTTTPTTTTTPAPTTTSTTTTTPAPTTTPTTTTTPAPTTTSTTITTPAPTHPPQTELPETTKSSTTTVNNCGFSGKIPHETDCQYYYECVDGQKVLRRCSNGLEFSPTLGECTSAETANCRLGSTPPTTTSEVPAITATELPATTTTAASPITTTSPPATTCPPTACRNATVYLPDESNPSNYIKCVNGSEVTESCPNGGIFDADLQSCIMPSTTCPPIECRNATIYLPDESNPSNYIKCVNGSEVTETCPDGAIFHADLQSCVITTNPPVCPPIDCRSTSSYLRDETDSSNFIKCVNGSEIVESCPDGGVFDEDLQSCIVTSTTPPPDTCPPTECKQPTQYRADETDEHNYIKCVEGKEVVEQCPNGGVFSENGGVCVVTIKSR